MKETIPIDGMGCEHCVTAVREALTSIEGVTVHEVAIGRAVVDYDVLQVDGERIYDAIRRSGYDVERDPAAR